MFLPLLAFKRNTKFSAFSVFNFRVESMMLEPAALNNIYDDNTFPGESITATSRNNYIYTIIYIRILIFLIEILMGKLTNSSTYLIFPYKTFNTPCERSSGGKWEPLCLSTCFCRFVSGLFFSFFFFFGHWYMYNYHLWHMRLSQWDDMSHSFIIPIRR